MRIGPRSIGPGVRDSEVHAAIGGDRWLLPGEAHLRAGFRSCRGHEGRVGARNVDRAAVETDPVELAQHGALNPFMDSVAPWRPGRDLVRDDPPLGDSRLERLVGGERGGPWLRVPRMCGAALVSPHADCSAFFIESYQVSRETPSTWQIGDVSDPGGVLDQPHRRSCTTSPWVTEWPSSLHLSDPESASRALPRETVS